MRDPHLCAQIIEKCFLYINIKETIISTRFQTKFFNIILNHNNNYFLKYFLFKNKLK